MILAEMGTNTGLYKVVLLLHILTAIIGFGGVILNGVYAAEGQKRPGPGGRAIAEANYVVSVKWAESFIYAVPVFGVLLVLMSDSTWEWEQTWIWASLLLYAISLGISHSILIPGARKINALLVEMEQAGPPTGGPPPQVAQIQALGKKQGMTSMVLDVALIAMLALMIWRPM